jgi:hypothetical protein
VNSVDSRGDITYPHSFHRYTTLGKHSLPPALRNNTGKHGVDKQRLLGKAHNNTDSDPFSVCPAEG